jgi:nucleoside-diphosphate-sugar epimerase
VDGVSGEIFNVAAGSPASVNHVAETIGSIVERPVRRRELPRRAGDLRDSWADLAKSQRVLGYVPAIALEAGLRATVDSLRG